MKISQQNTTPTNAAIVDGNSPPVGSSVPPASTTVHAIAIPPGVNDGTLPLASTGGTVQQPGTPPTVNPGGNQPAQVSPPTDGNSNVATGSNGTVSAAVALDNTTNLAPPPSIVRRIESSEVAKGEDDDSSDDDRKPAAKVRATIGQK